MFMSKKAIAKVAKMMAETGLMEVATEWSAFWGLIKRRIRLSKQNICIANAATDSGINSEKSRKSPENPAPSGGNGAITSPMVGVVYLAPEPNAKPFAPAGKKVAAGDTLCLIEAMKTFNPVKAPKDGVVAEILVNDGETVEFGTPLIVIE
jgi:acetyl-CoA carboxylase biotin carboxyl carrier protein